MAKTLFDLRPGVPKKKKPEEDNRESGGSQINGRGKRANKEGRVGGGTSVTSGNNGSSNMSSPGEAERLLAAKLNIPPAQLALIKLLAASMQNPT